MSETRRRLHLLLALTTIVLAAACSSPAEKRQKARDGAAAPKEAGKELAVSDLGHGSEASARDAPADLTDPFGGGQLLFAESFEDEAFDSRGWYDSTGAALTTTDPAEGQRAFACVYPQGGTSCSGGTPGRHLFEPSESVYVSYYVKYSDNFAH